MMRLRGLVHVHSRLSYDGCHSVPELVALARLRGYRFLAMAEHSDTLDAGTVARYAAECRRLSSEACVVVPGIEFACLGGLHLLGIGVDEYCDAVDPVEVAAHVRARGGAAIVAHPRRYRFRLPEGLLRRVHGVELWNAGYDGRFVPDGRCVALLREMRARGIALLAYGGQDLHRITWHRHVRVELEVAEASERAVVGALRGGRFRVTNGWWTLDATGRSGALARWGMGPTRWLYERAVAVRARLGVGA